MEDLRKNNNARKQEPTKVNVFSAITGFFSLIRAKWKLIIFWCTVILVLNIVFNPKNTAEFLSTWYESFVGTLTESRDE